MRVIGNWRALARAGVIGCVLAAGATAVTPAASAGAQAPLARQVGVTGHVSPIPAKGTPQLAPTGSTEQVRQLAKCGGTIYAVGSFTAIVWGGKTYARHNVFSFSATAPYRVTSWFTPGGSLLTNAKGAKGRYSRARGIGADDMLRTSAGLWIASDTFAGSLTCGGVTGHAGICFLPSS